MLKFFHENLKICRQNFFCLQIRRIGELVNKNPNPKKKLYVKHPGQVGSTKSQKSPIKKGWCTPIRAFLRGKIVSHVILLSMRAEIKIFVELLKNALIGVVVYVLSLALTMMVFAVNVSKIDTFINKNFSLWNRKKNPPIRKLTHNTT